MCLENLKKNPYYLFWLGVLIGALVTGFLFAYKIYWVDSETAVLKSGPTYKIQQQKGGLFKFKKSAPATKGAKKGSANTGDPSPWNVKKGEANTGDPNPW